MIVILLDSFSHKIYDKITDQSELQYIIELSNITLRC